MMSPKDLINRHESFDKAELIDLISGVYESQDERINAEVRGLRKVVSYNHVITILCLKVLKPSQLAYLLQNQH
jgi:hypothetical protein